MTSSTTSTSSTTRRRFLQFGIAGTALLGVGCALRWAKTGYALPADEDPPVALTVKEFLVVRAAVEALFPASGAFPSGVSLGVHRRIDEEAFAQRADIREDFTLGLHLLEHAPPLMAVPHRFTALDVDARARVLRSLIEGGPDPLVWLCASLQQMASVFYYAQPATWPAIHYDGPWVPVPMPPPSSSAYAEALAHAKAARGRTTITHADRVRANRAGA